MATTNDSSDDKKTMDVAKPGKPAPDASGRPVIVSHKPMIQDPMVKSEAPTDMPTTNDKTDPADAKPVTHGSKVIKRLDDDVKPETEKKDETQSPTESSEAAVVDAVVDQAAVDKKKENEADEAEKAKQAQIAKLIEEKKYFVKVGQVARRRHNRRALIILILLVLLVGGYLVLDAGVVKAPFEVPIHLIKK